MDVTTVAAEIYARTLIMQVVTGQLRPTPPVRATVCRFLDTPAGKEFKIMYKKAVVFDHDMLRRVFEGGKKPYRVVQRKALSLVKPWPFVEAGIVINGQSMFTVRWNRALHRLESAMAPVTGSGKDYEQMRAIFDKLPPTETAIMASALVFRMPYDSRMTTVKRLQCCFMLSVINVTALLYC
jgi:hypothetical protein